MRSIREERLPSNRVERSGIWVERLGISAISSRRAHARFVFIVAVVATRWVQATGV